MATAQWTRFPHPAKAYDHAGAALAKHWARLHAGDQEPFPDAARVDVLLAGDKALKKKLGGDSDAIAQRLQDGWRAFHRGDFQQATDLGIELGNVGATLANKASGIYATYLCSDDKLKMDLFQAAAARAEAAAKALPDDANAHYFRAFAYGRYSQGISIAKALSQGLGGKIRESLDAALRLAPAHAEAHSALGLYHAEIISKIGAMIGGLTYGAKAETGLKHLQKAIELTPHAPIAQLEYGNGLLLLYGNKREDQAAAAYEAASKLKPLDAMEKLDLEEARAQIE